MSFPAGPYTLASTEPIIIDGIEREPRRIMRQNDGSLTIMAPHPEYLGERVRLGLVDLTVHTKRGEAWKLPAGADPAQEAVAALWMAAPDMVDALMTAEENLVGAYGEPDPNGPRSLESLDGRQAILKVRAAIAKALGL
jgi:hypothetical protein